MLRNAPRGLTLCIGLWAISLNFASCSKSPEDYAAEADRLRKQGKFLDAEIILKKAIAAAPENPDWEYQLSRLNLEVGDLSEAVSAARNACTHATATDLHKLHCARTFMLVYVSQPARNAGLRQAALRWLEELRGKEKYASEAARLTAIAQLSSGNPQAALDALSADSASSKNSDPESELLTIQALFASAHAAEAVPRVKQFIQANPKSSSAYGILARHYEATNKLDEAAELYRNWRQAAPDDLSAALGSAELQIRRGDLKAGEALLAEFQNHNWPNPRLRVGDLYAKLGQYSLANAQYVAGEKEDAANRLAYLKRRSNLMVAANRLPNALAITEEAAALAPEDEEIKLVQSKLLLDLGERAGQEKALTMLEALSKGPSRNRPGIYYQLGRAYFLKGDLGKARLNFETSLRQDPYSLLARYAIMEVLLVSGNLNAADEAARAILELDPGNLQARVTRASVFLQRAQINEAAREIQSLNQTAPDFIPARLLRGHLLVAQGKFVEAARWFATLKTSGPQAPAAAAFEAASWLSAKLPEQALQTLEAQINVGKAMPGTYALAGLLSEGARNDEKAIQYYRKAIEAAPQETSTQLAASRLLIKSGRTQEAFDLLQKALPVAEQKAQICFEIGRLYEASKQINPASQYYAKAVEYDPKMPEAHNNLAMLMSEQEQRLDVAEAHAKSAIALRPNDDALLDTLAYVYLRQKKPQDAYTILRGVTERNPNQPEILMHLAEAQILMGNKLEGKKTLDRILALEPPATIKSKANQLSKSL